MRKKNKLFCGIGVNDANYALTKRECVNGKVNIFWVCPFYRAWASMLKRCYSEKQLQRNPTYKDCTVCDEWLTFSNFKAWMEKQDWQGKELDKDLLFEGNKIYSPDTCIFVSHQLNKFTTDHNAARGEYLLGVNWLKKNNKFVARCSNPFTGEREYLGLFADELQAHKEWGKRKHELACQLASTCEDARLAESLKNKYAQGILT